MTYHFLFVLTLLDALSLRQTTAFKRQDEILLADVISLGYCFYSHDLETLITTGWDFACRRRQPWLIYLFIYLFLWQVVRIPGTTDATFKSLVDFGQKLGKTTVDCKVRRTSTFLPSWTECIVWLLHATRILALGKWSSAKMYTICSLISRYMEK